MDITALPLLLALAWLLPLASFVLILFFGRRMGKSGYYASYVATAAVMTSFALSLAALVLWLWQNPLSTGEGHHAVSPQAVAGDWYVLGRFGSLAVTIGYYIDSLTVAMFCMVTLVASCIHVYSIGYMHGELSEVFDTLAPMSDGQPVCRRGRFHRFFQYLSLFCFSMLGLVIAGNVAMVFVFWELVGICSYLLIGFWYERKSASNAANKAFIVNRVGDFGMIVGLMALWGSLGTFSFGEIFSQVRPAENGHELQAPDGMVMSAAPREMEMIVAKAQSVRDWWKALADDPIRSESEKKLLTDREFLTGVRYGTSNIAALEKVPEWRSNGYGYGLLVLAGLGIFCGCVGKSAQFPLHVWLPDAMEGPTPVSALIHAATMVAAGVYLVGRFYPVFTPEVLLVIACVGCITLLLAASIALVATDIKRVLAYSTVSQLGFMMLALGVGGWLAGMLHLFTHAFFKSLLFLCSGSVIHSCGTNEMPKMGGLRRKMPYTATTMLIGCLAIAGAGVPMVIGLSGFHSKDHIIAQALSFKHANPLLGGVFFYAALLGAGLTAFYMFRLWYMTFAGQRRDEQVYRHAHESPKLMTVPLMVLAIPAIAAAWTIPWTGLGLAPLLHQAEPAGIAEGIKHGLMWPAVVMPAQKLAEHHEISVIAEWAAFAVALVGFTLATAFYGLRKLDPDDVRRSFPPLYWLLHRKWLFDELYAMVFVRPLLRVSSLVAAVDRNIIDWLADHLAQTVAWIARLDDWIDRVFVDALVNLAARWTYAIGIQLRSLQTGNIRQYVMWIVVGTVGLFVLMNLYWGYAVAGG